MTDRPEQQHIAMRGYVCFIYSAELGTVLVGFSLHPKRRLAELQAAHPYPLELLGAVGGSHRTERRLHAKWERHQLNGDWFVYAPIQSEIAKMIRPEESDADRAKRVIENFAPSVADLQWAAQNAPHVDIERLTTKWRTTVRTHEYRNANGLIQDASASWRLAMLNAEEKGQQRDTRPASNNRPAVGLATLHGMRTWDDIKRERGMQTVQSAVTAGSLDPVLGVRSGD